MSKLDVITSQGEIFIFNLTHTDSSDRPVDLSTHTAYLEIRTYLDTDLSYKGTTDSNGSIYIRVPETETKNWLIGKHSYKVRLRDSNEVPVTVLYGAMRVF